MSKKRVETEMVIEAKKVEVESWKTAKCAFCGKSKSDFNQPGKSLHGKWCCPECQQLL